MSALTILASTGGEEFHAPGLGLFDFPPLWDGAPAWLAKPTLLTAFGSLILIVVGFAAFARPKLVPRGIQNLGELGYLFVRDQIARPMMGKDGDQWMPLLVSLFFFVFLMNLFGVLIILQFPVMAHIAFPAVLAIMVWVLVQYIGIKSQGFGGYFKNMMFPPNLPKPVYVLVAPIELASTFVLRHFTHAVRLFATMMAGHLLLALFSEVGWHFLVIKPTLLGVPVGVLGVAMTILLTAFEMFIQALQAYVFAMLTATFIAGALHPEH